MQFYGVRKMSQMLIYAICNSQSDIVNESDHLGWWVESVFLGEGLLTLGMIVLPSFSSSHQHLPFF